MRCIFRKQLLKNHQLELYHKRNEASIYYLPLFRNPWPSPSLPPDLLGRHKYNRFWVDPSDSFHWDISKHLSWTRFLNRVSWLVVQRSTCYWVAEPLISSYLPMDPFKDSWFGPAALVSWFSGSEGDVASYRFVLVPPPASWMLCKSVSTAVHAFSLSESSCPGSRESGSGTSCHWVRWCVHPRKVSRPSQGHLETNETNKQLSERKVESPFHFRQ